MPNLDPGKAELPEYPWYTTSDDKIYPQPDGGVDERSKPYMTGWQDAVDEKSAFPKGLDGVHSNAYYEGYTHGIFWKVNHGLDPFLGEEMLKTIPPAVPADQILPVASEVLLPPIPIGKTGIWLEGWSDAFNLRDQKEFTKGQSHGTAAEYREGYHSGVEWLVDEKRISVNVGRRMLGLEESDWQGDEDIEEGEGPTHHAVKHPSHYTFGKYEVIDVLHDWQLPYPLDNVVKYAARAGKKGEDKELEDLEKARFYLNYRIAALGGEDWNPDNKK